MRTLLLTICFLLICNTAMAARYLATFCFNEYKVVVSEVTPKYYMLTGTYKEGALIGSLAQTDYGHTGSMFSTYLTPDENLCVVAANLQVFHGAELGTLIIDDCGVEDDLAVVITRCDD